MATADSCVLICVPIFCSAKAGKDRYDNPRCVVAFACKGVLERLVIQAKERGVPVIDRCGPLGSNPKRAARATDGGVGNSCCLIGPATSRS